jgi:hypothetical protein
MNNLYSTRKVQTNNYSGFTGVYWQKSSRNWVVRINYNGKSVYIGTYKNIEDAIYTRQRTETACDILKKLEVSSFEVNRQNDGQLFLYAMLPQTDIPMYVYGGKS